MKNLILLLALAISTNVSAQQLTKPFKLLLNSPDGKIDFSEHNVWVGVKCDYKKFKVHMGISDSGVGFVLESCGHLSIGPLSVTEKNEIEVPAISAFKGNKGANLDNYTLQITLSKKVFKAGQNSTLTVIAQGKKVINELVNNKEPINFLTVKLDNVNVVYKGENFFGSPYSLQEKVRLLFRIPTDYTEFSEEVRRQRIIVNGKANGYHLAATAKELKCPVCSPLDQVNTLTTEELSFARLGDKVEKVAINLVFESQEVTVSQNSIGYGRTTTLGEALFQIPLTQEAFESIKEITLVEPK